MYMNTINGKAAITIGTEFILYDGVGNCIPCEVTSFSMGKRFPFKIKFEAYQSDRVFQKKLLPITIEDFLEEII